MAASRKDAAARRSAAGKGPKPIADVEEPKGKGGGDTFMHEQRAADEADERHGQASKSLKQTALYANELSARMQAARKATSSVPAIRHDLERAIELAGLIGDEAAEALDLYSR